MGSDTTHTPQQGQDEVGSLPSFGLAKPTADADMFSMLPQKNHIVNVNDSSTAHHL
jgi:hypothetical protein